MSSPETALAAREKAPIAMGSRGVELRSLEDLYRFAQAVAKTPFAPRDFTTPEAIMIAVQYGAEVGLSPMASLQGIAVVNGKPSLYGDALIGVVRASGLLEDFAEWVEGEGDERAGVCRVKRRGMPTEHVERFTVADAKAAKLHGKGGPWSQYQDRMLKFRARGFALRDQFADVLHGLISREEAEDYPTREPKNVTPIAEAEPTGRITQRTMRHLLSRSGACRPQVDANALAVEHFRVEVDCLSEREGLELLDVILAIQNGEQVAPPPSSRVAGTVERLAENAPDVADAMRAYMPSAAPVVDVDGADLGLVIQAEQCEIEAPAPSRAEEDEREQLVHRLKTLRADELSLGGDSYKQPALRMGDVKKMTNGRLRELCDEAAERIRLIEER
jgi:hypothetical protein